MHPLLKNLSSCLLSTGTYTLLLSQSQSSSPHQTIFLFIATKHVSYFCTQAMVQVDTSMIQLATKFSPKGHLASNTITIPSHWHIWNHWFYGGHNWAHALLVLSQLWVRYTNQQDSESIVVLLGWPTSPIISYWAWLSDSASGWVHPPFIQLFKLSLDSLQIRTVILFGF